MAESVAIENIWGNEKEEEEEKEGGDSEHPPLSRQCGENGKLSGGENVTTGNGKRSDENGNNDNNLFSHQNEETGNNNIPLSSQNEENGNNDNSLLSRQNEENGKLSGGENVTEYGKHSNENGNINFHLLLSRENDENRNIYKENGGKSDHQLSRAFLVYLLSVVLVVVSKVSKFWRERRELLPLTPVQRQCVVGVVVAGVGCSLGVVLAYPALALDTPTTPTSSLNSVQGEGEVNVTPRLLPLPLFSISQAQWFRSVVYLSSMPGSAMGGVLVQVLGPRRLLLVLLPALTLTWLLLLLATPHPHLLLSLRALQGVLVSSCSLAVYVYPCEVVEAGRRGVVGALPEAFFSLGFLLAHLLASLLSWPTVVLLVSVCLILPAFLVLSAAPESPIWLVNKGRVSEAVRVLRLIRPQGADVEKEVLGIQMSRVSSGYEVEGTQDQEYGVSRVASECMVKEGNEKVVNVRKETVVRVQMPSEPSIHKPELRNRCVGWRVFLLPLLASLVLVLLKESTGQIVVVMTSVRIFKEAGMGLSPLWTSVLVSLARFVANLGASFLLMRLPRRHILIATSLLACVAMLGLAGFFHTSEQGHPWPGWVPFLLLMTFVMAYGGGIGPVVSLFVTELLPGAVRGIGSGLSNSLLSAVQFGLTYVASMQDIRFDLCFGGYAAGCFLLTCFALILPETKDRKLEDVEQFWQDLTLNTSCLGWCTGSKFYPTLEDM
ncbi:hypothetical protein Pcinc_027997 [Petrolisthes cinctipes]|uniref:Major facilitator superfamily (MFS) profile domain-containing protein n=1 Tax=Petrolisthes cinctipes TaxID=88211 RepID=A0AAE1F400_PETCI|nr:hypothetical protein Pcinc_027997 [Petrolisthes cinctipes]